MKITWDYFAWDEPWKGRSPIRFSTYCLIVPSVGDEIIPMSGEGRFKIISRRHTPNGVSIIVVGIHALEWQFSEKYAEGLITAE